MKSKLSLSYQKINLITISAVYLLILIGGIVRSTGAGMGCPDWPKCFGQYIPPTSADELPLNYKDIYSDMRHEKNIRVSNMLKSLGFTEVADRIIEDERIREEADFNAVKTWIEYINRLVGVVIGLLIFATLIASISFIGSNTPVFVFSLISFVLVGFQGWLGSIVVSTNLLPGMISIHMFVAILITFTLILGYFYAERKASVSLWPQDNKLAFLLGSAIFLFLFQILFGIQVREQVDMIGVEQPNLDRNFWVDEMGFMFYVHRSYSLLIFGLNAFIAYRVFKHYRDFSKLFTATYVVVTLIFVEILSGASMAYFGIPAFLQPLHLFLATIIIGLQFYTFCWLKFNISTIRIKNKVVS